MIEKRADWISRIAKYWQILIPMIILIGAIYTYAYRIEELEKRTSRTESAITEINKSLAGMDKSLAVIAERLAWISEGH